MKANVIDLSGNTVGQVELPSCLRRGVSGLTSSRGPSSQPKLTAPALRSSLLCWHEYISPVMGSGTRRLQSSQIEERQKGCRHTNGRRRQKVACTSAQCGLSEKINIKERRKAIRSAIAATASKELVAARGHRFARELPVVAQNDLETLTKTADVIKFLVAAGLWDDVERAKIGRNIRAGKGKAEGKEIQGQKEPAHRRRPGSGPGKAARNLPGVDFITVEKLNAELLAPGTKAGRLTIWTESSLQKLNEKSHGGKYNDYQESLYYRKGHRHDRLQ